MRRRTQDLRYYEITETGQEFLQAFALQTLDWTEGNRLIFAALAFIKHAYKHERFPYVPPPTTDFIGIDAGSFELALQLNYIRRLAPDEELVEDCERYLYEARTSRHKLSDIDFQEE